MSNASFRRHEGFFQGHGDLTLFFQTWEKTGAEGTVLITHGQGEHSECYHRLVDAFAGDRWNFWAWDMRGHGRSEGRRGYASNFEDYVLDYRKFLNLALEDQRLRGKPVVLLSHSMGGLVQLKTLIEKPDLPVDAQVCSSPLLGLAFQPPAWKETAARFANNLLPQITLWNELTNDMLTRDPDVIREFEQDVLRHARISPGVYLGFLAAFDFVRDKAGRIRLPTLFQVAEQDPVVSPKAAMEFFDKLGSDRKVLKTYGDGARHEIYNDIHRAEVFADLKVFLDSVLTGGKR